MVPSAGTAGAVAAVALPFVAAALVPLSVRTAGDRTGYLGALVALVCFGLLASLHGTTHVVTITWIPALEVALRLYVDAWALLFALLASGIGVLIFTYSTTYMAGDPRLTRYYAALLAFMGSIIGIALAGDLIALFVFWELTSVCSFVLIGHHARDRPSQYAARMAMFVTVGGGLALLVGLLMLSHAAGPALGDRTFDLVAMLESAGAMQAGLREVGLFVPALALVAVGVAAKSAQVPLHFWLPNAMAAPTPVSAFLHSATMVKVGVYLVGRLRPLFESPEWTLLFASVGITTMAVTALLAVATTDLKELLAYSTASHLGLMVAGFGLGTTAGAAAGAFHLLNHALFKAPLFLVVGIVAHETGSRHIPDLGGLARVLPATTAIAVVAGLSMAGIPPFNGFYSKELLFEAAYEVAHAGGGLLWVYPVAAVLASALTVVYSLRFLSIFVGPRPAGITASHRAPLTLVGPPAVLAAAAAVLSVAPHLAVETIVQSATVAILPSAHAVHTGLPATLSPPVAMTAVAIGLGLAVYPRADLLHDGVRSTTAAATAVRPTWWYDRGLAGLDRLGRVVVTRVHTGLLRTYLTWLLATACTLAVAGYLAAAVTLPSVAGIGVSFPLVLVLVVAVIATVAVVRAPSHVAGVLSLSLLGFMIAIFYILASAPDLALTQLVVETLALLIFLLVLEELPEFYGELEARFAVRDAALSAAVGLTVFLTVVFATADHPRETAVARFYTEQAVPGAGGTNIVNVILVDFRAFDTFGESIVIVLAAMSVLILIRMRTRGEAP